MKIVIETMLNAPLDLVHDTFHDQFFSADKVVFDRDNWKVIFPFYIEEDIQTNKLRFIKVYQTVIFRKVDLIINNVESFIMHDTEDLGTYDLNEFFHIEGTDIWEMGTNFPINIRFTSSNPTFDVITRDETKSKSGWVSWNSNLTPDYEWD